MTILAFWGMHALSEFFLAVYHISFIHNIVRAFLRAIFQNITAPHSLIRTSFSPIFHQKFDDLQQVYIISFWFRTLSVYCQQSYNSQQELPRYNINYYFQTRDYIRDLYLPTNFRRVILHKSEIQWNLEAKIALETLVNFHHMLM